jgi:DNA topoisomerase-1
VTREQVALARELGKDPATGKPVTVRMGRYGPFVQIGTKDDEEKPKFAGLRPGQKMDAITLDEAMYLFTLPRTLGETAEGEKIIANVGQFGPYLKYGAKYVSLKEDDPYTVPLDRALEVIRLKKEADANRLILDFPDDGIQVLNGRYGPYITDKKKNAKIPKDRDPKSLTLEECRTLIAAAPERGGRFGRFGRKKKATAAAAPAAAESAAAAATAKGGGKKKKAAAANGDARAHDGAGEAKATAGKGAAGRGAAGKGAAGRASAAAGHARAAARGAAKKAAATSAHPAQAAPAAKAKAGAHDGHKAAATASKAKATAKSGKAAKAPTAGKTPAARPRGVK